MDTKKWPVLGQILIGLGVIGGIATFGEGLVQLNILRLIWGVAGIVIYWSAYKFKRWALIGINTFLSLGILSSLIVLVKIGYPPSLFLLIAKGFPVLVLIYFNSAKIKELFH